MVQSASLDARLLRFRTAPSVQEGLALSEGLLAAGRAREACDVADAISDGGANSPALVMVGRAWIALSDFLQAQKALIRAARLTPNDPEPYRWLGEVLLKRGDPERAAKVLSKAQALAPGDVEIQRLGERATRLARIACQADQSARAAKVASTPPAPVRSTSPARRPHPTPPPARQPAPIGFFEEDEPTVIAKNTTETLARASAHPPEVHLPPPQPPPLPGAKVGALSPPKSVGLFDDEEELPTSVITPGSSYELGAPSPFGSGSPDEPNKSGIASSPERIDGLMGLDLPGVVNASQPPPPPPPSSPAVALAGSSPTLAAFEPSPPSASPETSMPFEATSDEPSGNHFGEAENVEAVLETLNAHGLFHPVDDAPSNAPPSNAPPSNWSTSKEARAPKTKVGFTLGVVWVVALLLAAGGYYGWTQWVAAQKAEAAALVEEARVENLVGDHASLIDAERHLRQARTLDPANVDIDETLLFTLIQRALEGGAFEAGFIQPALQRTEALRHDDDGDGVCSRGIDSNGDGDCLDEGELGENSNDVELVSAAHAVIAFAEGDNAAGIDWISGLSESEDPRVLYIIGRLEQRLGRGEAMGHLEAAAETNEELVAVQLALAEADADDGHPEEAIARLEGVRARTEDHLRAGLWLAYLQANEGDPEAHLASLGAFEERLEHGAPTDHVLYYLTRSRLDRRAGDDGTAAESAEAASLAGATEPRLQALIARSARSSGDLRRAQRAATSAVERAPGMAEYRRLLGEILVDRRDGEGALRVLSPLSMEDPEVLVLSARAALSAGNQETLTAVKIALEAQEEASDAEPSLAIQALQIRLLAALGDSSSALQSARRLLRANPGSVDAGLALAEAALEENEAEDAIEALEAITSVDERHPDAFTLLGRAQRMAGNGEAAEAALRRAIEVRPGNQQTKLLLGYVLLDRGKYEEADALFAQMASSDRPSVAARLGRIDALLGLGREDDAQTQFEALPERTRESASGRQMAARIALAAGRPDDAVIALRPLAESEGVTNDTLAFFGDALYAAGESRAAGDVYDRVLEDDDFHPEALIGFAEVLIRGEKYRDADAYLDDAELALRRRVRAPSVRARVLMLRGRMELEKNDGAEARETLQAATALPGAPIEAYFWLGEALAGHNTPEARSAYEHFMASEPSGPLAARARRALERE